MKARNNNNNNNNNNNECIVGTHRNPRGNGRSLRLAVSICNGSQKFSHEKGKKRLAFVILWKTMTHHKPASKRNIIEGNQAGGTAGPDSLPMIAEAKTQGLRLRSVPVTRFSKSTFRSLLPRGAKKRMISNCSHLICTSTYTTRMAVRAQPSIMK